MKVVNRKTVIALALLCTSMTMTSTAVAGTSIVINGKTVTSNVQPYQQNGTTMVPLRLVSESLGASVQYVKATKQVVITKGSNKVTMTLGKYQAKVNGTTVVLNEPPVAKNGTTMVPIRVVSEAFGCNITYNKKTNSVIITGNTSGATTASTNSSNSKPQQTVGSKDQFGNLIRTTNLPSNAKRFPYIQQGVPNWCYEQQPWDDNYWGPYYTKSLIAEKASKVLKFPSQVYAGDSELASVMADNYKTLDAFIKAQMCVDYRTINRDTYINSIANAVSLNTTGTDMAGLKKNAALFADYIKNKKVIIDTEYKILPETAWVYNYAPMGVMNFSVYMKVKPVTVTGAYFDTWGVSSVYDTKTKKSSLKAGKTYEGVITYNIIQQKDGTWKINANSCSPWSNLMPECDMMNGVAPQYKTSKREDKFNYTWTKDEKKFYTRYQKDCVDPDL